MQIYIVMVENRDTDTEAYPYSDPDAAIDRAEKEARELSEGQIGYPQNSDPLGDWIFLAKCSKFEEWVWVVEKELDKGTLP